MNKLRQKILVWTLKRQPSRKIIMPSWDRVRTIAVLYSNDNIPQIIQQLEAQDKQVTLFTLPTKEEICCITHSPKTSIKELLVARQFDLLIDLTQEPNITLQYMAIYIKADFKVGRYITDGIHDLTINTPSQNTPDFLLEQIIKYIKMLTNN